MESLREANLNLRRTLRRRVPPEIHLDGPDGDQARAEMAQGLESSGAQREFDAPEIHFGLRYRSPVILDDPHTSIRRGKPDSDWRPGSAPGCRAAHAWWDATTSTLDLFGNGFVLLCFAEHDGLAELERAFAERAVPLTVRNGHDEKIAKLYERPFVLVRPDGHVAWRGNDMPADPATFVDTIRGDRAEALT